MRHFKNYAKILSQVRYDKKNASALGKNEESAQTTMPNQKLQFCDRTLNKLLRDYTLTFFSIRVLIPKVFVTFSIVEQKYCLNNICTTSAILPKICAIGIKYLSF